MVKYKEVADNIYQIEPKRDIKLNANTFIIADKDNKKLTLIDCGSPVDPGVETIFEVIRSIGFDPENISKIINTHSHVDHAASVPQLAYETKCKAYIHKNDFKMLAGYFIYFSNYHPMKYIRFIKDGDVIKCGEYNLKVVHSPGHTIGHICLFDEDKKILFNGDMLPFIRVIEQESSLNDLISSVNKILKMDFDIALRGHGGPAKSDIEKEKYRKFLDVIQEREDNILKFLEKNDMRISEIRDKLFNYKHSVVNKLFFKPADYIMVQKHLERLEDQGKAELIRKDEKNVARLIKID